MIRRLILTLLFTIVALAGVLASPTSAHAALQLTDIEYGGGYGHANLYVAKGWSVVTPDSTGRPVTREIFQSDCNDVVYRLNANGSTTVIWASGSVRPTNTNCSMVFQQDGNKAIYQAGVGAIFATGTNRGLYYRYIDEIQSDGTTLIEWFKPNYGWQIIWIRG